MVRSRSERGNRTSLQTQSTICTRSRGQSAITGLMFFFLGCSVVDIGAKVCMPGNAILESTCYISRQMERCWQSCHRTRASDQERRMISIISDDSSFCARRLTARQAFVPAYRTHNVSFAGHFDCACVQIPVFEFQHLGCGCEFFLTI